MNPHQRTRPPHTLPWSRSCFHGTMSRIGSEFHAPITTRVIHCMSRGWQRGKQMSRIVPFYIHQKLRQHVPVVFTKVNMSCNCLVLGCSAYISSNVSRQIDLYIFAIEFWSKEERHFDVRSYRWCYTCERRKTCCLDRKSTVFGLPWNNAVGVGIVWHTAHATRPQWRAK